MYFHSDSAFNNTVEKRLSPCKSVAHMCSVVRTDEVSSQFHLPWLMLSAYEALLMDEISQLQCHRTDSILLVIVLFQVICIPTSPTYIQRLTSIHWSWACLYIRSSIVYQLRIYHFVGTVNCHATLLLKEQIAAFDCSGKVCCQEVVSFRS